MSLDQFPRHALFVRWGEFKAGAFGIPAIVVLAMIAATLGWYMLR
jgi:hypothetical protein